MKYQLFLLFFVFPLMSIAQQENVLPEGDLEEIDHQQGSCTVRLTYFCMRNEEEVKTKTHFVYDAINESDKETRYYVFTLNFVDSEVVAVGPGQAKQVWKEYEYNNFEARIVLKGFCTEFTNEKTAEDVKKEVSKKIHAEDGLKKLLGKHRAIRQMIIDEEKELKMAIENNSEKEIQERWAAIELLEMDDELILAQMADLNNQIQQLHQITDPLTFIMHYRGCALVELDVILFKPKHNGDLKYEEIKKEDEEDPGLKLCVNNDDDNETKKRDLTEEKVEHEDDLGQFWYFWARPIENAGHVDDGPLIIFTNSSKIKLWKKAEKVELANLAAGSPKIVPQSIKFKRDRMYIEAIKASEQKLGEYIRAGFGVTIIRREYPHYLTRWCIDQGNITNRDLKIIPFECFKRPEEVSEKCGVIVRTEIEVKGKKEVGWVPMMRDKIEVVYEAKMFEDGKGVLKVFDEGGGKIFSKDFPCKDGKNCEAWDLTNAKPGKYKIVLECDDCRDEIEVYVHEFNFAKRYLDFHNGEKEILYPTDKPWAKPLGDYHAAELFCTAAYEKGTYVVILAVRDLTEKTTNFGDPCWVLCLSEFLAERFSATRCWIRHKKKLPEYNNRIALYRDLHPRAPIVYKRVSGRYKLTWAEEALECHHDEDLKDAFKHCGIPDQDCAEKDLKRIAQETKLAYEAIPARVDLSEEEILGFHYILPVPDFFERYKKILKAAQEEMKKK